MSDWKVDPVHDARHPYWKSMSSSKMNGEPFFVACNSTAAPLEKEPRVKAAVEHCEYCSGVLVLDSRGNCNACGGPVEERLVDYTDSWSNTNVSDVVAASIKPKVSESFTPKKKMTFLDIAAILFSAVLVGMFAIMMATLLGILG